MANQQRKPKNVDARALVARLNQEGKQLLQREIIAPLLPGGRIRTRLAGLIYEFKPGSQFVGWGRFRPLNEREAEVLGEALPWERGAYLELFPALRMILLWPVPDPQRPGTWMAIPFNESDARQRFGFEMEPLPVFLCDPLNGAEQFERVIARVDGRTLWFEGPDLLADPTQAEWLRDAIGPNSTISENPSTSERFPPGMAGSQRLALLLWQLRQLELALAAQRRRQAEAAHQHQQQQREEERRRRRQAEREMRRRSRQEQLAWLQAEARRGTLEGSLLHALTKAGATLHSYHEITNRDGSLAEIVVEWSENGQQRRYRSTIDPHLTVVSSGICLSGHDRDFDLTSLVSVMTDAPWG